MDAWFAGSARNVARDRLQQDPCKADVDAIADCHDKVGRGTGNGDHPVTLVRAQTGRCGEGSAAATLLWKYARSNGIVPAKEE